MKTKKINISQSLIKDILVMKSIDPKDLLKPQNCPKYLQYKYVENRETSCTEAMLYGKFFEWHLIGATRDGVEPIIPKVNIRDLRPSKSASYGTMWAYIMEKAPEAVIVGTGEKKSNKPSKSDSKNVMLEYILGKGVTVPEKSTKDDLFAIIETMPEDLGEPKITQEDLYNFIQTLPPDMSEGNMSAQEVRLRQLVEMAKQILGHMGLDIKKGRKQVFVKKGRKSGNLDWVHKDLEDPSKNAIYDVKWTKTKVDDWRFGWGDPDTKDDAKIQALHYVNLYYEKYGYYPPFYFIVFGDDGWIKFLRYRITPSGLADHEELTEKTLKLVDDFQKKNFPAKPAFNRCLNCDFADICESRSLLPEIEEVEC